ncbi:oligopeptide ABC transporter substrate-binding protein [Vagococcus silagei]|uniref:Oligopeptide ABC transporter substrate-binding protein n=1 Tax=Vagococcus silagei TaxID=2508885 RepID=A0A4S3B585_9ENTE|nr:oligopeptide ABC transporter substrate-binding protein [Vagococcus silagei]THB61010.1 oligopeptide ABC transporter substrate-binding protein [Vagococcus silagei]
MKYKKLMSVVALSAVATIGLAACGNKEKGGNSKETATEDISKFPIKATNKDKAIKGGTLEVAAVMETQFPGIFSEIFYEDNNDNVMMEPSHESLFMSDDNFEINDKGVAKQELDVDAKKATITLTKEAKWSDGKPVVAEDIMEPYRIVGHKDYTGIRYGENFRNIVGMEDYHTGKAENISGIKKIDDKTVEISYVEMNPGMTQSGEEIWRSAVPAHVFKDIPVKDMVSSDAVRKTPVTFGPYKINKVVRGESVEYVPNEYYYGEKPKLDKIVTKVTPSKSIVEGLKSQNYDMVIKMPTDSYPNYKDVKGYEILGRQELSYSYLGFKMGKIAGDSTIEYNKDAKMANKSLRQAMAYAVDNKVVADKFYNGLRTDGSTLIPPVFAKFHAKDVKGYKQDMDKANKLLDEAGYKKKDGEDFRRDPKGEKLEIKFASMSGGDTAQPLAEYYMNQWKEIGLDVKLTTGRLLDQNAFYDKLQNDDPEIDVYQAAWGTGSNPSPTGLYGPKAAFNYTRFTSEENTKLLKNIDSNKSFDADYRLKAFKEWQEYAKEEAFAIPTLYRNEVRPISERVTGFDWAYDAPTNPWAEIGVTAESRK